MRLFSRKILSCSIILNMISRAKSLFVFYANFRDSKKNMKLRNPLV